MAKDPIYLDKVVLAAGGSITTQTGVDVITVADNGQPTIEAPVTPGDVSLDDGKYLVGNSSNVGVGKTVAGSSSAPVLTMGGAAITATLNGFTGTTSSTTTTITAGGATVAAHALAGAVITDGTTETTVLDNSALTATTGTISTVLGLAATITATGKAYKLTGIVSAPTITITAT